MKLRSVLFASAALIWAAGCDIKEEDKPQPQGPQITVPAESQKVFSEGISFESSSGSGAQTSVVKFTAAASWSTDLKDTKSSDWLSVRPQSGVAGDVEMNVTAQPNIGENARSCEVTIVCGDEKLRFTVNQAGAPVIKVESVTLSSEEITLAPGSNATLVATVMPENAADKTVTWSSSDEKIATVADGLVTAVAEGQAVIKAVAGDKEATCVVKVKKETVPVSSVTLNKTTLSLQKGQSEALTAIVKPDDATNKDVTWSSSDPSVASVDKYGIVTGQKSGSATIKAMAGDKSATCSVTVTTPVESITLDRISVTLEEGQTTTLVATINPSDADNKTVTWSSSNSQVATVSGGVVTAVAEGTAVITASADGKEAKCSVTVQNSVIQVTSVTLNKSTLSLQKGQSETLTATVKPTNATDKTVTWSSSDATIVSVDQNGLVSALKSGTATVMAKAGEKSATCTVTVTTPVVSVTLDRSSVTLEEGQSTTLTATISPNDADEKTVSWSSSDTHVATVSNGVVTAEKEGSAVITASAGGKQATCVITVQKHVVPVTSVTINKSTLNLKKGESETLVAAVNPSDATDKTVTWSSSDATIAIVDQNGTVAALRSGSVTIVAKAGEQSATCTVTVTTPVELVALDRTSVTLEEGQATTLIATISPNDADEKTVTWTSSNSSVASVDGGVVTAIKEGTATITASAGGKQATCTVTVQKLVVPVTSVTLNKSTLSLQKGENETLTATVGPDDATDKTVTWSSSDATIVSVDQEGHVSAVKSGTATVSAKAGDISATCTVTVTTPVVSVTLDRSSVTLEEGQNTTLIATVNPSDADEKTVSWTSSDTRVATVNDGVVTAVKEGSAVITAKVGGKEATCTVTVQKAVIPVTSLTLNKSTLNLKKGESETLVATVNPSDATDKTVTWSSRDASIAIVDQNGTVAALSSGTVIIEAKAGEQSATCTVTVTTPVELVTLDITSITLEEGQSTTLTATITPSDADEKTVTWTSSDTRVATVNNGVVTAVAEGNATITASAGGKEATCRVTVQKAVIPVTSVTLNKSTLSLFTGGSETLVATVTPSDATDNTVTWSSSDASVASVDQNGLVSAVKSGTATIKASAGGKEATCAVEVRDDVFDISPTRVELMAAGGTFEVKVTTYREYHINSKPDWITEKSVSNQVHTFEASANTSSEQRSGVIVFCDDKGTCLPCQIVQDASGPFTITPTSVEVEADGGQFEVTVSCSTIYHINSMPEWVEEVTPANNGKVHVFKVGKNSSEQERSGVVVFCDDQGTCLSCFVKQKPHVPDSAGGGNEDVTDGDPINW